MFDLDHAIATWRRFLATARSLPSEDLEELETHLRDEIDAMVGEGFSQENAFYEARRRLGDYATVEAAYERVYWRKMRDKHNLINELKTRIAMLTNYIKSALRSIRKHLSYTFINVTGLAVGLAVCLLILLFVQYSFSFDRFHDEVDRIYRVVSVATPEEGDVRYDEHMPPPLATALSEGLPEIETAVRFATTSGNLISRDSGNATRTTYEDHFIYADSSFFDVFSFPLLRGDPATALARPFDVVLSETSARRYFGDENPVGQTLTLDNSYPLTVTGVAKDTPSNTSIRFDFLSSLTTFGQINPWLYTNGWNATATPTYLMVREGVSAEQVEAKIPAVIAQYTDATHVLDLRYDLEPISDIHLHSKAPNQLGPQFAAVYLYIFSLIALLILAIACINYMNLATAQATTRAREVGVRKVVGAKRSQLAGQFLSESMLMSLLAVAGALGLVWLLLPLFIQLVQQDIPLSGLITPTFWAFLPVLVLVVGLLAGSYPALLLSRFKPTDVLKGNTGAAGSGVVLRKGLVVFQFIISIALIVSTFVIQSQLDYLRTKRLGLNEEQVIVLPLQTSRSAPSPVIEQREAFKGEVQKLGIVEAITFASAVPARPTGRFNSRRTDNEEMLLVYSYYTDPAYLETLGMEVIEGRGFLDSSGESGASVLINEAAVQELGWDRATSVGRTLPIRTGPDERTVVGVVGNFHFESLHKAIEPVVFRPIGDRSPSYAILRVKPADLRQTLNALAGIWQRFSPQHPFDYFFLDDAFAQLYQAEDHLAGMFNTFTALAILIACLGLFGLAAFSAQQRTKEIGIRKVFGASTGHLVALLSKDFLKLVLVAFVIAAPLAYFAMNRWLEDFAYHVEMSWTIFLLAGLAALLVALLTVSYQAIRASLSDPVKALRYQ